MPDVIRALEQIGAGKAARELERALSFAGADPLVDYCDSLSVDAQAELDAALNVHVSLYLDDYLRFVERQA